MDWYIVVKTINGHRYRYRQKTWRENGRVRTKSEYLGPVDPKRSKHPDLTGAATLPLPFGEPVSNWLDLDHKRVDRSFATIMEEPVSREWDNGWDAKRRKNQVNERPELEILYTRLGVTREESMDGAYFNVDANYINLPPKRAYRKTKINTATERYYRTFAHELVHWTGHRSRLKRFGSLVNERDYAKEELIAEFGALLLLKAMGCEMSDPSHHQLYFKHYLDVIPLADRAVVTEYIKSEAVRAVRYILERGIISK